MTTRLEKAKRLVSEAMVELGYAQIAHGRGDEMAVLASARAGLEQAERSLTGTPEAMSPTQQYVDAFAKRMEARLAQHRDRGDRPGWLAAHPIDLFQAAWNKMVALQDLVRTNAAQEEAWKKAADAANFLMMVADSYEARAGEATTETGTGTPWPLGSAASGSATEDRYLDRKKAKTVDGMRVVSRRVAGESEVLEHGLGSTSGPVGASEPTPDPITSAKRERY